ncbi:MAG TPA: GT-D fold domain-containing glycosyltransferase [Pedobacter sp.]|uniref:GT-D fold domain-containing glycosyltransferase n=1 Tax=Pedobacter sp. TaxID=1411316 RepID=UPI002BE18816|nr:GT-D fold domain-containing glycosyltransferase [Pedobacter sp.]HMI00855.1 GT-D fold domain-containing glycosyltransferase [Pedobacter sp.]
MKIVKYLVRLLKPFKNFVDNILFLFKYNIQERNISAESLNHYLDNIRYEIQGDMKIPVRPEIEDPRSTLEKIITEKCSVSRFGDGEFELLQGKSIEFQVSSTRLQERLREILISNNQNVMICIPHYFWYSIEDCNSTIKDYTRGKVSQRRTNYEQLLLKNKRYFATEFTQLYMTYDQKIDLTEYFERLRSIWLGRDITVIQGSGITKGFKFDIFDNALSVNYLYAPSRDAFSQYDVILENAKQTDKGRLILIILGPTATVLAYDLAISGFQALDLGHTAKDFNFYKNNVEKNSSNIHKFYMAD